MRHLKRLLQRVFFRESFFDADEESTGLVRNDFSKPLLGSIAVCAIVVESNENQTIAIPNNFGMSEGSGWKGSKLRLISLT